MSDALELPPLPSHPDPQGWKWTELELRAIEKYGRDCYDAGRPPLLEEIERLKIELNAANACLHIAEKVLAERDELRAKLEAAQKDGAPAIISALVLALGNPKSECVGFKRIPILCTHSVHDPMPVDGSFRDLPVYEWKLHAVDCPDLLTALLTAIDAARAEKSEGIQPGQLGCWPIERLK